MQPTAVILVSYIFEMNNAEKWDIKKYDFTTGTIQYHKAWAFL